MRKYVVYIPSLLQFVATFMLLSVVCISSKELPPGELAKQWWWLARMGIFYTVLIWVSFFFYPSDIRDKWPGYSYIVVWVLIFLGGWEAVLGLRQIYGLTYSNHSLFTLTGTFFNPGPYSGYLAMVFPMCLSEYFRLKRMVAHSLFAKIGHYIALVVLLLIVCILPAGMSRSAWLASGISGLFVAWWWNDWGKVLKQVWRKNRRKIILYCITGGVCFFMGLALIFYMKQDSANGRLFMWRMGIKAISERPFAGYGVNGFPNAYGLTQEAYFAAGNYAEWEEHVAGSPEYAFNEYIQVAIEWGIPVLLFCLILVALCLRYGIQLRRIGVCGGIISLLIFSLSSYPLQLPVFIVTFIVLLFSSVSGSHRVWLMAFSFGISLWSLSLWKADDFKAGRRWAQVRQLYNVGAFESARSEYEWLYPTLKNRAGFMFEYARCLHKLGEYDISNNILQEASLLTSDPMVLNVMGQNYQMKGEYVMAEKTFLRSVHRLPGRIYPYFLLAKLYAEPGSFQPEKFKNAARKVIEKEPKVQSTAIKEMRQEIQRLQKERFYDETSKEDSSLFVNDLFESK